MKKRENKEKIFIQIKYISYYNILYNLGPPQRRNRDSQENCYKYQYMQKSMVEPLTKFESCVIKIALVN